MQDLMCCLSSGVRNRPLPEANEELVDAGGSIRDLLRTDRHKTQSRDRRAVLLIKSTARKALYGNGSTGFAPGRIDLRWQWRYLIKSEKLIDARIAKGARAQRSIAESKDIIDRMKSFTTIKSNGPAAPKPITGISPKIYTSLQNKKPTTKRPNNQDDYSYFPFNLPYAVGWPLFAFAETTRTKPNILFIMADDLGKEWISCYGAEDIETPNIDALAAGGMKFNNAYSMPACTPALPCLQENIPAYGMGKPLGCSALGSWILDWKKKENTTFARLMKELG